MGTEPSTKTALLRNAEGRWTIHHYLRTEYNTPITIREELADGAIHERAATGAAFVFSCSQTGAERRYGIQ